MLYKKSRIGTRYVHLMTSSPYPFLLFVAIGITSFILATSSITVDSVSIYPASLDADAGTIFVDSRLPVLPSVVFVYTNRNEAVVSLNIDDTKDLDDGVTLFVSPDSIGKMQGLGKSVYLDVSSGKETLLRRIILRAGKNNE